MTTIALVVALICSLFLLAVMTAIAVINRKEVEALEEWVRLGLRARRALAKSALAQAEAEGDSEGRSTAILALHDIDVMERITAHH